MKCLYKGPNDSFGSYCSEEQVLMETIEHVEEHVGDYGAC